MNPEILTISENVTLGIETSLDVFDSITVTEDSPLGTGTLIAVFDSTTVTEDITIVVNTSLDVFDLVTITENFPVTLPDLFINVSDTSTLSEGWDRSIPGFQMPFSRPQGTV